MPAVLACMVCNWCLNSSMQGSFQLLGLLPGLLHGRHTVHLDGKLLDLLRRGALN